MPRGWPSTAPPTSFKPLSAAVAGVQWIPKVTRRGQCTKVISSQASTHLRRRDQATLSHTHHPFRSFPLPALLRTFQNFSGERCRRYHIRPMPNGEYDASHEHRNLVPCIHDLCLSQTSLLVLSPSTTGAEPCGLVSAFPTWISDAMHGSYVHLLRRDAVCPRGPYSQIGRFVHGTPSKPFQPLGAPAAEHTKLGKLASTTTDPDDSAECHNFAVLDSGHKTHKPSTTTTT
jgi:hypothetical protein